jgi:hypothetical protein
MTLAEAPVAAEYKPVPKIELPALPQAEFSMPGGSRSGVFAIVSDTNVVIDPKNEAGAVFAVDNKGNLHHRYLDPDMKKGNKNNRAIVMKKGWKFVLFSKQEYGEAVFNFEEDGIQDLKTEQLTQTDEIPGGLKHWINEFVKITASSNPDPGKPLPYLVNPARLANSSI